MAVNGLTHEFLSELPLFAGLSVEEYAQLSAALHKKSFQAGAVLMASEQPGEVAYVLLEGTVKVLAEMADGKQAILAFLGPGDTVGEMSLIDSAGRSATAVALERCAALAMDRTDFTRCLKSMPRLTYNLVQLLSRRLRLANEQIRALSSLDVAGRLARQLSAFADRYGTSVAGENGLRIGLKLTQTDLADLVGASRERVNQVMGELKGRGLVTVDSSHRLHVHDPASLAELGG